MFELPQQYVGGGVFVNFLQGYSSTNTAINEQAMSRYLSQFDPAILSKEILAIEKQKEVIRRKMKSPSDAQKYIADDVGQLVGERESTKRTIIMRESSAESRLAKKIEQAEKKSTTEIEKIFNEEKATKGIIKALVSQGGGAGYTANATENIKDITGLNNHSINVLDPAGSVGLQSTDLEASMNQAILTYVAGKGTPDPKKLVPNTGLTQGQLTQALIGYYGIKTTTQSPSENKNLLDIVKDASKENVSNIIQGNSRVSVGSRPDTSIKAARRDAEEVWSPFQASVKTQNEKWQAEIDILQAKQDELTLRQSTAESKDFDPNKFFLDRGVTNTALGSVRIAPGRKPRLRQTLEPTISKEVIEEPPVGEAEPLPLEASVEQMPNFNLPPLDDEIIPEDVNSMLMMDPDAEDTYSPGGRDQTLPGYAYGTRKPIPRSKIYDRPQDDNVTFPAFSAGGLMPEFTPVVNDDDDSFFANEIRKQEDENQIKIAERTQKRRETGKGEPTPRSLKYGGTVGFEDLGEEPIFNPGALDETNIEKAEVISNIQELYPGKEMDPSMELTLQELPLDHLYEILESEKLTSKGITPELKAVMVGPIQDLQTLNFMKKRDKLDDYETYEQNGEYYLFPAGTKPPSKFQFIPTEEFYIKGL